MRIWLLACVTSAGALLVAYHNHDAVAVLVFIVVLIVSVVNVIGRLDEKS